MREEDFNLAANYIQSHHQEFSKDSLLKFYGAYKQVTAGSLNEINNPKPSFFRISERSKWEAWNSLKGLSEDEAREKYINLLTELKPDWKEGLESSKSKQSFGVAVSCLRPDEPILDEVDKTIEDFIKEGNVEKFKELLNSIESKEELNSLDDNDMGLIHWAADRGNLEILKLILSQKDIDINLVDGEQHQTALHYASSCGHSSCISQLLKHNADKSIKDNDGNSPLDVAFDEEIKKLLC